MISVLTTSWSGGPHRAGFDEHGLVARWVAGAASAHDEVEVTVVSPQPVGEGRDGAFWLSHLPARQFSPVEALVLARSLAASRPGTPPAGVLEELAALAGCPSPAEVADPLERRRPSAVVLAGWALMSLAEPLRRQLPRARLVCLPMAPPVPELSVLAPALPPDTRLLALTGRQDDRLAGAQGLDVRTVGLPVSESPDSQGTSLALGVRDPVLVLVPSPPDALARAAVSLLRRRHREPGLVLVSEGSLQVSGPTASQTHHFNPTRADLAHLMAGASVTVDLRRFGVLGCDALESLRRGTPAVVPADSPARDVVEEADAGLWFSDPAELAACVETLVEERTLSGALGDRGRRFATERWPAGPPTVL